MCGGAASQKSLIPEHADDEARKAWEARAQASIAQRVQGASGALDGSFRRKDTDSLWRTWSHAMEEGLMDAMGLPEDRRSDYRGHGQVAFRQCHRRRLPEAIAADQSRDEDAGPPPGGRINDPLSSNCAAAGADRARDCCDRGQRLVRLHPGITGQH